MSPEEPTVDERRKDLQPRSTLSASGAVDEVLAGIHLAVVQRKGFGSQMRPSKRGKDFQGIKVAPSQERIPKCAQCRQRKR